MSRNYQIGDQPIPGYRLAKQIGQGRTGTVWKATASDNSDVALKIIELAGEVDLPKLRNLRLITNIRHPNLISIHGLWLKNDKDEVFKNAEPPGDRPWGTPTEVIIVMDLAEKNLAVRLRECLESGLPAIPAEELIDYLMEAAKAIDHLNQPSTLAALALQHSNIKPTNILLVGGVAQVGDVGLSGIAGEDFTWPDAKPYYRAPELFLQRRPAHTTDQYSLAITYVELRTGVLPFSTESTKSIMSAHVRGQLDLSGLTEPEQQVIRRATHLDPSQRFARAIDMVRALRAAVSGQAVSTTPKPGLSSSGGPPPRRTGLFVQKNSVIVPGYTLIRPLGSGGFGEVWEASAPGNIRVAMKIVRNLEQKAGKQELKALQLIQNIRHANLMGLHAYWFLDAEGNVISTPASEGGPAAPEAKVLVLASLLAEKNLMQRLKECQAEGKRGIPQEELLTYLRQAASAIDYLNEPRHQFGDRTIAIQHRDIKPANILIVGGTAMVADFGLARLMEGTMTQLSAESVALTVLYAAPEMLLGKMSRWSDQYSLAITYYQMRTGTLPFACDHNPYEVIQAHTKGLLDRHRLPDAERAVVARATSLQPEARWPNCTAMARAMEEALREGAISSESSSAGGTVTYAPEAGGQGRAPTPPPPSRVPKVQATDRAEPSPTSPHSVLERPAAARLGQAPPAGQPAPRESPDLQQTDVLQPETHPAAAAQPPPRPAASPAPAVPKKRSGLAKPAPFPAPAAPKPGISPEQVKPPPTLPKKPAAPTKPPAQPARTAPPEASAFVAVAPGVGPMGTATRDERTTIDEATISPVKPPRADIRIPEPRPIGTEPGLVPIQYVQPPKKKRAFVGAVMVVITVVALGAGYLWLSDPLARIERKMASKEFADAWALVQGLPADHAGKGQLQEQIRHAWLEEGRFQVKMNKPEAALLLFDQFLQTFPQDGEGVQAERIQAIELTIDQLTQAGEFVRAGQILLERKDQLGTDGYGKLEGQLLSAWYQQARQSPDVATEQKHLEQLLAFNPGHKEARSRLDEIIYDLKFPPTARLAAAEKLLDSGDTKQALAAFNKELDSGKLNAQDRQRGELGKARALIQQGNWAEARKVLDARTDPPAQALRQLSGLLEAPKEPAQKRLALLADLRKVESQVQKLGSWEHKKYQEIRDETLPAVLRQVSALGTGPTPDWKQAKEVLDQLLAFQPANPTGTQAVLLKADIQYRQADFVGLQKTLEQARPTEPKDQAEVAALQILAKVKGGTNDEERDEAIQLARKLAWKELAPARAADVCMSLFQVAQTKASRLESVKAVVESAVAVLPSSPEKQQIETNLRNLAVADIRKRITQPGPLAPNWLELLQDCDQVSTKDDWIVLAQIESLIEKEPPDVKRAKSLLANKAFPKADLYAQYVRALLTYREQGAVAGAQGILNAFQNSKTPEVLKGYRLGRASRILLEAIGQTGDLAPAAARPFQNPFPTAADVDRVLLWIDKALQLHGEGAQLSAQGLERLKVLHVLATANQAKPGDPAAALKSLDELLAAPDARKQPIYPALLVARLRCLPDTPAGKRARLETYCDLADHYAATVRQDETLAETLATHVLGPARTLAHPWPSTATDTNLKKRVARLHGLLADLLMDYPHARWVKGPVAEQTLAILNEAIRLDDTQAEYYVNRGRLRLDLPKPDLERIIREDLDPAIAKSGGQSASAHGLRGYALLMQARSESDPTSKAKKFEEAIASCTEAVHLTRQRQERTREYAAYLTNLSNANLELGNLLPPVAKAERKKHFEQAREAAREATSVADRYNPENAWRALGNAYEDLAFLVADSSAENFNQAIDAFGRAIKEKGHDLAKAYIARGRCLYRAVQAKVRKPTDLQEAIKDLEAAKTASLAEDRVDAHFWLGQTYEALKNTPQAIVAFTATIQEADKISPGNAGILSLRVQAATHLGRIYQTSRKPAEALKVYRAALPADQMKELEKSSASLAVVAGIYFPLLLSRGELTLSTKEEPKETARRDLALAVRMVRSLPDETILPVQDRMRAYGSSGIAHHLVSSDRHRETIIEHLEKACALDSSRAYADHYLWRFFLGENYLAKKDNKQAKAHYLVAHQLAPADYKPEIQKKIDQLK